MKRLTQTIALILAIFIAGCTTSTPPSRKPPPLPPLPPGVNAQLMRAASKKLPAHGAEMLLVSSKPVVMPRVLSGPLTFGKTGASNELSIEISGTNVIVSWPTNGSDFMLFSSVDVKSTNAYRWVSNVVEIGTNFVYVAPMTNTSRFFKLQSMFQRIVLAWDYYDTNHPPSYSVTNDFEPTVDSFKVYWGNSSGVYTASQTFPRGSHTNTTYCGAITNKLPVNKPWFFMATACATNGLESDPSNEISIRPYGR